MINDRETNNNNTNHNNQNNNKINNNSTHSQYSDKSFPSDEASEPDEGNYKHSEAAAEAVTASRSATAAFLPTAAERQTETTKVHIEESHVETEANERGEEDEEEENPGFEITMEEFQKAYEEVNAVEGEEEENKNNNDKNETPNVVTFVGVEKDEIPSDEENEELKKRDSKDRTFLLHEHDNGIDFLQDKVGHQTYGRRIAMYLSERYAWYNPYLAEEGGGDDKPETATDDKKHEEKPSIAKAWAFFEHVTLSRYEVPENHRSMSTRGINEKPFYSKLVHMICRGDRSLQMAEPGDDQVPTKLYSALNTPLSQLGDFGLGYGLYFSSLRAFAVLSLIAGIINIPSMVYYGGKNYDVTGSVGAEGFMKKGSAICEDRSWVPCPTCEEADFDSLGYYVLSVIKPFKAVNETGQFLNISEYITFNNELFTFEASDNWSERLYEDYRIKVSEDSDDIIIEGYGTLTCEDGQECDQIECEPNDAGYCYLDLRSLPIIPPYADTNQYTFAKKTNCEGATRKQGFLNLATAFFFILGSVAIYNRQKAMIVKFDEDEQTAQDYSINILNPPPDAHNPDEWKEFFEKNFENCHVTVVTVDVENDDMQKLFINRREILKQIALSLPPGTPLDMKTLEEEAEKAKAAKEGCLARLASSPIPKLVPKLKEVTEAIKTELKKETDFPSTNIFVTFETEAAQRDVLTKLSLGSLAVAKNDANALPDPKYLFRGNLVLEVDEPEEPSAIIWEDLNAPKFSIVARLFFTNLITLILLLIGFFVIIVFYLLGLSSLASIATTVCTIIFPMIAKSLANSEYHRSESSRQKWMFIKISIFNIALTSVLLAVITPFNATLDPREGSTLGLIPAVHALFYSQLLMTPAIQLLDPMGHVSRHLLAPRAKTQEAMNMNFRGSEIFLSERYANMVKFLYLMVWYCAIYPGAFFMGSFALFVVYFTDRFSLMRTWARTPQVGSQIADFARNYFVPVAIVLMVVFSSYAWSGFPYDKLCEDNDATLDPNYIGDWSVAFQLPDIKLFGFTLLSFPYLETEFPVLAEAQVYKFCQQDLRAAAGRSFPPLAKRQVEGSEWMTQAQEDVLQVYGWTAVVILIIVIVFFVISFIQTVMLLFTSSYQPVGKDKEMDFSKVRSIDSYIPQKKSPFFAYPLLMCDLSDIDPSLFSWSDPDKPHSHYSLYEDMKEIMDPNEIKIAHVFGDVKHWPPKK